MAKNPEEYLEKRMQKFEALSSSGVIRAQDPESAVSECWVSDPTSFPNVFKKCSQTTTPTFDLMNNLGYFEYQSKKDVSEWIDLEEDLFEMSSKTQIYGQNMDFFLKYISEDLFQRLDFELVVYDEIEKFRKYDHPKFSYPYEARKSKLNSFTLDNVEF